MSEKAQSDLQSTRPSAPNGTEDELRDSLPIIYGPQVSTQDPLPIVQDQYLSIQKPPLASSNHRISIQSLPAAVTTRPIRTQELLSPVHSQHLSIEESPPTVPSHQVSTQEPLPAAHGRRVSIQDPLPATHGLQVSTQDPLPATHGRRVSIQDPLPATHGSQGSIEEAPPATRSRWVSIQEPPPATHSRRVSIQEPPPATRSSRVSIQEPPPAAYGRQLSVQEPPPTVHNRPPSIQESPPTVHTRPLSVQESPPLNDIHSASHIGQSNIFQTTTQTPSFTDKQTWPSVHIPPSITWSPTASIDSLESVNWSCQEIPRDSGLSSQLNQSIPDDTHNFLLESSPGINAGRFQKSSSRQLRLPIGWRLLHEARKISRLLSLVLTLAGLVIIGLISLGQPWMHFQVPLMPPGDPAGTPTMPINTILFVRCSDISCLKEYDQYAYLLDLAWAFLFFSSITSLCLCVALILLIFTSSKLPMPDFFLSIGSIMTGTSIALGVLFYLWQADRYLQEGMTYRLGISFYLAWIGIFLFLMSGFFSYLNYMNFWSILALQAVWT